MLRLRQTWAAMKNLVRVVRHDPVWAIASAVLSPVRTIRFVVTIASTVFIAGLVLSVLGAIIPPQYVMLRQIVALAIVIFMCVLAMRLITDPLIAHFGPTEDDTHGSARFATPREIAKLPSSTSALLIGRDGETGKLIRYSGESHLMTMAPTRTGKGVGTIIPNLLTADRSVICIDPKGENTGITALTRASFGPVHVLDPFEVTNAPPAAFNPLDHLDPYNPDLAEEADTLADALVFDEPGMTGEAHWNEEAKALMAGMILHVVTTEGAMRKTLVTLRQYLTLAPEQFKCLLAEMQASIAAGGLVARAANRHLGKSDREAAGVLSSAQRHTHFLDSPRMARVLGRSDFRFTELKQSHQTIFLVLPPDRLSTYSRWLRLVVTCSLIDMARTIHKPDAPVLYMLDEFAALGHLQAVEKAMGLMAGYGVQLWPILQDVHQLRATYGTRAGTFLSNTGLLQVFGVNDHASAELVSGLLGQETVVFQTMSRNLDAEKSGLSISEQHAARQLLTPDEVRNLPPHSQLLFLAGQRPILARKIVYYADREFKGLFGSP